MFNRRLDDVLIDGLNSLFKTNSWWHALVEDPDVFIAIRDGYLNVYANGGSIARVCLGRRGSIACEVHAEYLTLPAAPAYIDICNPSTRFTRDVITNHEAYRDKLKRVKLRVKQFAGEERLAENKIAKDVSAFIDIEVAFSQKPECQEGSSLGTQNDRELVSDTTETEDNPELVPDARWERGRIDMVSVNEMGKLVFTEVKHHKNPETKSRGRPAVFDQLLAYRDWLSRETRVVEVYERARKTLCRLEGGFFGRCRTLPPITGVDPIPRLLLYGYDGLQEPDVLVRADRMALDLSRELPGLRRDHIITKSSIGGLSAVDFR